MSREKEVHLDYDNIILAVVDEGELPEKLRDHLSRCPLCRAEKERVEGEMAHLGRLAEQFSPSPTKRFRIPYREQAKSRSWLWQMRPALAMGLAAALVMAVVWWGVPFRDSTEDRVAALNQQMWQDYEFMSEIEWLEEHALPETYFRISGEYGQAFSRDFMLFVIPSDQAETSVSG